MTKREIVKCMECKNVHYCKPISKELEKAIKEGLVIKDRGKYNSFLARQRFFDMLKKIPLIFYFLIILFLFIILLAFLK